MAKRTVGKTITLNTNDGEEFELSEALAMKFLPVRYAQDRVMLPSVTAPILKKVIVYCEKHNIDAADASKTETTKDKDGSSTRPGSSSMSEQELSNWDKEFVDVDLEMLYGIINAALYLDIDGLLELAMQKVFDLREEKRETLDPKRISQAVCIVPDFTVGFKEEIAQKKITLESNDGGEFIVPEMVAVQSPVIRQIIEDGSSQGCIPLPKVSSKILEKVILYCIQQLNVAGVCTSGTTDTATKSSSPSSVKWMCKEEMSNWDNQLVDFDLKMLVELMRAAKYLKIEGLLDFSSQKVVNAIKEMTPEQICRTFIIENDSPEKQQRM